MTYKNRIIAFAVTFSLILSLFIFSPVYAQKADFASENAYNLLCRLNMDVKNENVKLTRLEFITAILQLVKQFDNSGELGKSCFDDVQGVAAGIVNTAMELGYIHGSGNGMFRPYDYITFEEAIVICVRVLGYEYAAGETYSFAKYYNIANSKDITDGVDASDFDAIAANVLMVNMLNAQCADTIYGENKITISQTTLIESVYGISPYTGTVEAINGVSVTGVDTAPYGKVRIDGALYQCDEAYATSDFLGNTADCYITKINGTDTLFAMYKYEEGNTLILKYDDISSVESDLSALRYYEGKSSKNAKLAKDLSVVYNGTKKFNVSSSDFLSENVVITLTDGDKNGVYETAIIENPEYYKIAAADAKNMYIGSFNGKPALELEELSDRELLEIVKADGTPAAIEDIKKGTYIEVLYSKNNAGAIDYTKNIKIVILSETVSGKIDSIEYGKSVFIEGKEYSYNSEIAHELTLGTVAVFYMGTNGKLIGISDVLPDAYEYGYLVGVKKDSGLSGGVSAKIFTHKGEMKIMTIADKVSYTGYIGTEYAENAGTDAIKLTEYITDAQLVKYYTDARGVLLKIMCAYDYTMDSEYEGNDDTKFTLEYHNRKGSFYNIVASEDHYYDNNSLIFSIPENGEDRDYSVGAYTEYPELNNVDIKLYDSSSSFICRVGVMTTSSTLSADFTDEELGDQNIAVISKKYKKIQDEDEVIAFKAYCKSKEVTLVAKREDLHDASVSVPSQGEKNTIYFNELNPGDVIQYKEDAKGKVILINVLHRFDKNDFSSKYYTQQANMGHLSIMITQSGLVDKYKPDGFFTVADSDGKKYNFSDTRVMYHIYIYDINTGDVEIVNPITYMNAADSANPDYVFVKCRRTSLRDLVVYRSR